jgi:YihY family inner membrane protein
MQTFHAAIPPGRVVMRHPGLFARRVLRAFRANQGLLLAGAVAYYTLLSLVPLLILVVMGLSHVLDAERVLATIGAYLDFVAPGAAKGLMVELQNFLAHRDTVGGLLLLTLLFFSALAFTVLENAMSVVFHHRVRIRRRRFLVSAMLPYLFVVLLGTGFLVVSVVSGALESLARPGVAVLGVERSLEPVARLLFYLVGVFGEIAMLTAIYLVMPVGRLSLRHALFGGVTAGLLWELTRHALVWYYGRVSQIQVVYGSLTTAVVILLSVEIGAIFLLLGAQVIAEYERLAFEPLQADPPPLRTAA